MSEEEIIKEAQYVLGCIQYEMQYDENPETNIRKQNARAIKGLLDLYNKQKEELEDYKSGYFFTAKQMHFIDEDYIAKDKIIGKIEELEEKAEEVKEHYRGTYACLDEYLNAKSKIQGYKELLEE